MKGSNLVQEYKDRYTADKVRRDKLVWLRASAKAKAIVRKQHEAYYENTKNPLAVVLYAIVVGLLALTVLITTLWFV